MRPPNSGKTARPGGQDLWIEYTGERSCGSCLRDYAHQQTHWPTAGAHLALDGRHNITDELQAMLAYLA